MYKNTINQYVNKMTWYNNPAPAMSPTKLYHSELGIPPDAKTQHGSFLLTYSQHALQEAQNDRYGNGNIINLPKYLDTSQAQVIEVEMTGNKTTKVLYRIPYDEDHDLVMAVIPDRGFVKTVWLNENKDLHKTLDHSKYDIPDMPAMPQIAKESLPESAPL